MAGYLVDEDNIVQGIMMAADRQSSHALPWVPAHISSYDPANHMVRCLVPQHRDPFTGEFQETGWLQLLTPMMGNGFGMQYAPFGGATQDNLQAGEQVHLLVSRRTQTNYLAAALTWNATMPPPMPKINAGELVVKDAFGNMVYFQNDGTILVSGATNVVVEAAHNVTVNSTTVNVNASQSVKVVAPAIDLGSSQEALLPLVTQAFQELFNEHTHPAPNGTTGVPNQQMTNAELTSVVQGG